MYPHDSSLFGTTLSIWNTMFLIGIVLGYLVLRSTVQLSWLPLRYLVTVYVSAIGAKLFAYAFDANTSLWLPVDASALAYYLDPLSGPKTLYGAIVVLPASVALATVGTRLKLRRALDLWTPMLLAVLSSARVGCWLQGCCYGVVSPRFGVSFPVGSPVYFEHVHAGLVASGERSLPVVPTQAAEAAFLAILALLAFRQARSRAVFVPSIVCYSVFRFAAEFARADTERGVYGLLATSQWIALAVIAGAALAWRKDRGRQAEAVLQPISAHVAS